MILNEISQFIIVDDLNNEYSKSNFVHFLSKPSSLLVPDLKEKWKSKIFTSKLIIELGSSYKKMKIKNKKFNQLIPNERTRIEIPSTNDFFTVTLLETQCCTGKILLLFENSIRKRFLYSGEFTLINNLPPEVNLLISGVDYLFLDNTLACNHETISIFKAFTRIEQVVKNYPKHKFVMICPDFGYEELIIRLSKKFKIILNAARRNLFFKLNVPITQTSIDDQTHPVQNCLGFSNEDFLNQTLRFFKKQQIIFIRFQQCIDPKFDTVENTGVYYVNWSPHPTFNHLYAFVLQIKPKRIKSIYSEFPEIPEIIQELCEVDEYEEIEQSNSLEQSEDDSFSFVVDSSDSSSGISWNSFEIGENVNPVITSSSLSISSDSNVTVIFNPSQNTQRTPVAQSTPNDCTTNILLKRKTNVLENCKKKLSRNFPQTKLMENRGVNYLD